MMMKQSDNIRKLNEDSDLINKFINEELGISNEIKNAAEELYNEIIEKIKEKQSFNIANGVGIKKFPINTDFFGKKISISVQYINFKDKGFLESYKKKHDLDSKSVSLNGRANFLWLNIISISGYFDKSIFVDTVFHELEHLYQQIKANKSFSDGIIYSIAYGNLKNENEKLQAPAQIIYLSSKSEQDAFANGLYGYFLSKHNFFPDIQDITETELYNQIEELRKNIQYLKNNINNEGLKKSIKENYNKTIDFLLKLGEKSEKELLRKIGRVIIKLKNDFFSLGGRINFNNLEESKNYNFYNI